MMDNLTRMFFGQSNPFCRSFAEGDMGGGGGGGAPDPNAGGGAGGSGGGAPPPNQVAFSWKGNLAPDFANSPTMQKFADTKEGFNEAVKSHLSLEQMLGHDKVPIPKGADDAEGWSRFSKAMGVPDKADGYGLPDAEIPGELKNLNILDKRQVAELAHSLKLTPGQAKGVWDAFVSKSKESYSAAVQEKQKQMTEVVNRLRGEWGDAYDTNVELGQMVINKFADEKEAQDFITATLLQSPYGVKFLAKVGGQFAENKIGDFGYKKFSLTPDQAQSEIDTILRDSNHPYNNDKAAPGERDRAIDYVNSLYALINKYKG